MAKNRRKYRRGRRKKGNWFTRMKLWQKIVLFAALVLLLLLGSAAWYVLAKWDKVDTQDIKTEDIIINPEIKENKEIDLGDGFTNIALFGVDSRDRTLGEGNRTDCIIVASLNNETKEIKMVSVYRDTLLDLSEGTYQKCNAAYSYGGPTLAINMLNMNLDLDIQDYVTVDFGAIVSVIDALGGLDIEILPEEVEPLNQYIGETAKVSERNANYIEGPGLQHLDGVQATTYARIRSTAGGDFTRTERQRLVIEKMVEKLKAVDVMRLNSIIDVVFPQVSTSFTLPEILNYALAYKEYVLLENTGFPFDQTMDTLPEIGSVVIPTDLTSNVSKLHEFLFGTVGYVPSSTVNTLSANITYTASNTTSVTDDSAWDESYDDTTEYDDTSGTGDGYYDQNAGTGDEWQEGTGDGTWDDGSGGTGDGTWDDGSGGTGDGTWDDGSGGTGDGTWDDGTGGVTDDYIQ